VGFEPSRAAPLPSLLRYIDVDPKLITIVDFAPDGGRSQAVDEKGVTFVEHA